MPTLRAHAPEEIIAFGGITPLSESTAHGVPMVALNVHAPSGTAPIVRLVPEQLMPVEQKLLQLWGLRDVDTRQVGETKVTAVGFPEWPIIADPKNAVHALNIVGDLRWVRKNASSRSGRAKKRADGVADTLAAAAPHFLPTFYEEIARIFKDVDRDHDAALYLSKAREAERIYNLPIDPERHKLMILECAERGMINAKDLRREVTSWADRCDDAGEAYRYIMTVIGLVTRAGTAPYAGLVRDITRLGKAAGQTRGEVAYRLAEEVAETPGLCRAAEGFLTALCKQLGSVKNPSAEQKQVFGRLCSQGSFHDAWRRYCDATHAQEVREKRSRPASGVTAHNSSGEIWPRFAEKKKSLLVWGFGPLTLPYVRNSAMTTLARDDMGSEGMDALVTAGSAFTFTAFTADEATTWLNDNADFIQCFCEGNVLTPGAALVLLAGGYHPNTRDIMRKAPDMSAADRAALKKIHKALGVDGKTIELGVKQLQRSDPQLLEQAMEAFFDRDLDALRGVAKQLPQTPISLTDADLQLLTGWTYDWDEDPLDRVWRALLPQPERFTPMIGYFRIIGTLLYLATALPHNDPARPYIAKQLRTLATLDRDMLVEEFAWRDPIQGPLDVDPTQPWVIMSHAIGDTLRALTEGYYDTVIASLDQVGSGGIPFNPENTAPDTLTDVAKHLQLSIDAARYFLQVLCLADPTDARVKHWNAWSARELTAARTELVERELLVEATRKNSGRKAFLPGGWWEATSPHRGMEMWKTDYYPVRYAYRIYAAVPWTPPMLPAHELFAAAWKRYREGDVPGHEELKTTPLRRQKR